MAGSFNDSFDPEPSDNSLDDEIRELAFTILELMPKYNGWVSWRKVAKLMKGSEEFAYILSALAEMEQYKHLFVTNSRVVRLTEAGIRFAQDKSKSKQKSEHEKIAEAVRRYASGLDRTYIKIHQVARVAKVGKKVVQAFFIGIGDEPFLSETPVEIRPAGSGSIHGKIVGSEAGGGVLYIALDCEVYESQLPAVLSIDRGYLIYQLAERIRNLEVLPPRFVPVISKEKSFDPPIADDDSVLIARKLALSPPPWTKFLWGPPGAGKTYGLGRLVLELLRANPNEKILIVAPSNRSVDVALELLVKQLEVSELRDMLRSRKVLRYGYPRKNFVLSREELLGPSELDQLNSKVRQAAARIVQAEREEASSADLAIFRAELLSSQEDVKNAVTRHVQSCNIVATTTTLAYLPSSPISSIKWSTVLVDEVTMVTPAMCAFLASLSQQRFLLAGDPRQLGPVYERDEKSSEIDYEWMGKDVFEKSGVSRGSGQSRHISLTDTRLARITSQRRCGTDIWARVTHLYPEVNNLSNEETTQRLSFLPPQPGEAVVLLDTSKSSTFASCEKVHRSWQNQFTAELALEVAFTIAAEGGKDISIAIIAPYRAQVRLLRDWLRQEQKSSHTPGYQIEIDTGTVHQFQGSDADVVIFDMVDGPGRSGLGALLRGDPGLRLVNVAVTRAKGKLIILANKLWCQGSFSLSDNPLLWELVMGRKGTEQLPVLPPVILTDDITRQKTQSPIEEALYDAMKRHPELQSVIAQHIIRDHSNQIVSRADFAFPSIKYAIYCDGRQWHLREDRWQRDIRQRNRLTELGWIFSVFTGSQIFQDSFGCANQILSTYLARVQSGSLG